MLRKKLLPLIVVGSLMMGTLAGCGAKTSEVPTPPSTEVGAETEGEVEPDADADISGEITVLTNRTDLVDTIFVGDYAVRFNEKYPDVKVKFESMDDYEGQVKIRMNTEDYGDVLLIPQIDPAEFGNFFEPLGQKEDMSQKYRFLEKASFEGVTYGIPQTGNVSGIVYNKRVFEEAGITDLPKTPEEFIAMLGQIKENTEAIPLYTNYVAGWALDGWQDHGTSVAGDASFNNLLPHEERPFDEGKPLNVVYKTLHEVVAAGLVEPDPLTSDWESSKQMLADGEIGVMVLGSWVVSQVQELADNPDEIGYMPFPYVQEDGKVYSASDGDFCIAVNKHSKNKEAALAWLNWFIEDSGYAYSQGGIPPVIGEKLPSTLEGFEELGVVYLGPVPPIPGEEGLVNKVDDEAEIGFYAEMFKKRIVESALGSGESFEEIMNDLNARWASAREALGVN